MPSNVRVIPNQSARIRAFAHAHPDYDHGMIGLELGYAKRVVELALSKGDTRRPKSVLRLVK